MKTAEYWIKKLNLLKHPEGGYYRETYRSDEIIKGKDLPERYKGDRCFSTLIYFLLAKKDISSFHKIKSDEIWHFYEGSPLTVHLIDPEGNYTYAKLGPDYENNEMFQFLIPKGSWFAAEINDKNSFSLIGCTVAPGFDFSDFELGKKGELLNKYPQYSEIITRLANP